MGKISYGPSEKEKKSLQFRRSLYVVRDMAAGEEFTPENLRLSDPGWALRPRITHAARQESQTGSKTWNADGLGYVIKILEAGCVR